MNAYINLESGIKDAITGSLDDFSKLFEALCDDVSEFLQGAVHVTVGDWSTEVPFVARIAKLVGPVVDYDVKIDGSSGEIHVTIVNAIESVVHLPAALGVAVLKDKTTIPSQILTTTPAVPADLKPASEAQQAETMTLVLKPQVADASYSVDIDQGSIRVLPDAKALWDALVDPRVSGKISRRISVHVPAGVFAKKTDARLGVCAR